jgi:hypothetical protein
MRLKAKPVEPKRKMIAHEKDIDDFSNCDQLLQWMQSIDLPLEDISIETIGWYESASLVFSYKLLEDEHEYEKRLLRYQISLESYNNWYEENTEEIKRTLQERKEKKTKKHQREIEQLEKRLRELKGGVDGKV